MNVCKTLWKFHGNEQQFIFNHLEVITHFPRVSCFLSMQKHSQVKFTVEEHKYRLYILFYIDIGTLQSMSSIWKTIDGKKVANGREEFRISICSLSLSLRTGKPFFVTAALISIPVTTTLNSKHFLLTLRNGLYNTYMYAVSARIGIA